MAGRRSVCKSMLAEPRERQRMHGGVRQVAAVHPENAYGVPENEKVYIWQAE